MMDRSPDHHTELMPCRECARLELLKMMSKHPSDAERYDRLIAAHRGELQPHLFGAGDEYRFSANAENAKSGEVGR